MDRARTALLLLAAAGATWGAGQLVLRAVAPVASEAPPAAGASGAADGTGAAEASDRETASDGPAASPPAAAGGDDAALPRPEDIEAELEQIEKQLESEEELPEFTPSKPLPADVPIALPSDI